MNIGEGEESQICFRFGEFLLDVEQYSLCCGEKRVHLTGKPFETLLFLVKNHGRTGTK